MIREGKGDYVLALKRNQGVFYEEVAGYFDGECQEKLKGKEGCYRKTVEPEHGGVAVREYYITEEIGWYSDKEEWKGLRSLGYVHKELRSGNGKTEKEDRYYICSIGENMEEFERASRGHWGIENNLHWQLDFTFKDDKNRSMGKTGGKNLQTMKKNVLSILNIVKASYRLSMKRIRYEMSLDYEGKVEKLLSMLDEESIKKALESAENRQKKPV